MTTLPPRPPSHDISSHDRCGPQLAYRMDAGGVNYELYLATDNDPEIAPASPATKALAIHEQQLAPAEQVVASALSPVIQSVEPTTIPAPMCPTLPPRHSPRSGRS
jgi:hypothetical protein